MEDSTPWELVSLGGLIRLEPNYYLGRTFIQGINDGDPYKPFGWAAMAGRQVNRLGAMKFQAARKSKMYIE